MSSNNNAERENLKTRCGIPAQKKIMEYGCIFLDQTSPACLLIISDLLETNRHSQSLMMDPAAGYT